VVVQHQRVFAQLFPVFHREEQFLLSVSITFVLRDRIEIGSSVTKLTASEKMQNVVAGRAKILGKEKALRCRTRYTFPDSTFGVPYLS
jgi:hypothetical protein